MSLHQPSAKTPSRQRGIFLLEAATVTIVLVVVSIILTHVLHHVFP